MAAQVRVVPRVVPLAVAVKAVAVTVVDLVVMGAPKAAWWAEGMQVAAMAVPMVVTSAKARLVA